MTGRPAAPFFPPPVEGHGWPDFVPDIQAPGMLSFYPAIKGAWRVHHRSCGAVLVVVGFANMMTYQG